MSAPLTAVVEVLVPVEDRAQAEMITRSIRTKLPGATVSLKGVMQRRDS